MFRFEQPARDKMGYGKERELIDAYHAQAAVQEVSQESLLTGPSKR